MFKFLVGVVVGVLLITCDVIPKVRDVFLDTGARDTIVNSLKEIER